MPQPASEFSTDSSDNNRLTPRLIMEHSFARCSRVAELVFIFVLIKSLAPKAFVSSVVKASSTNWKRASESLSVQVFFAQFVLYRFIRFN